MFGIARPCRHHLGAPLHQEWMAHLCGLCLSLKDGHGQVTRVLTNVDAVALSLLTEAQQSRPADRRLAGPCPLRGLKTASVIVADEPAAAHATAVSLTMAVIKLDDHVEDAQGLIARAPRLARLAGRRLQVHADRANRAAAFDAAPVHRAVAESTRREKMAGLTFEQYVAPTEDAAAGAFRHTGVLAGRPDNDDPLDRLGRMFGRIVYLLDAVEDRDEDRADGRFNALDALGPDDTEQLTGARRVFDEAHEELARAFDDLTLQRRELARAVLVDQVRRAGHHRFRRAGGVSEAGACSSGSPAGAVALAALSAIGGRALVFKPGEGPDGGFAPGSPIDPQLPAAGEGKRRWWSGCCDREDGCDLCCCCCCDSCDGDCCDCGDC